jgi:hypothetical protein
MTVVATIAAGRELRRPELRCVGASVRVDPTRSKAVRTAVVR